MDDGFTKPMSHVNYHRFIKQRLSNHDVNDGGGGSQASYHIERMKPLWLGVRGSVDYPSSPPTQSRGGHSQEAYSLWD